LSVAVIARVVQLDRMAIIDEGSLTKRPFSITGVYLREPRDELIETISSAGNWLEGGSCNGKPTENDEELH
jgi:hypothetical protein